MIKNTWIYLLHLIENTFDGKRIYANPSSYPNSNPNTNPNSNPNGCRPKASLPLKRNYVFGLTKWRHFLIKCNDTKILLCHLINEVLSSSRTWGWEPQLFVKKHEAKSSLLIARHLLYLVLLPRLGLFLNFEQKWASCFYKIVLLKKCSFNTLFL